MDGDGVDGVEGDAGAFKDGMLLTPREDGRLPDVPDGYTVVQGDGGALLLRKKRQRNLQKLGIGGFQVRRPWARVRDKEEDAQDAANPQQTWVTTTTTATTTATIRTTTITITTVAVAVTKSRVIASPNWFQQPRFDRISTLKPRND